MINSTEKLYILKTNNGSSKSFIVSDKEKFVAVHMNNEKCSFGWGDMKVEIMDEILTKRNSNLFKKTFPSFCRGELVGDSISILEGQDYYNPDDLLVFKSLRLRIYDPVEADLVKPIDVKNRFHPQGKRTDQVGNCRGQMMGIGHK